MKFQFYIFRLQLSEYFLKQQKSRVGAALAVNCKNMKFIQAELLISILLILISKGKAFKMVDR